MDDVYTQLVKENKNKELTAKESRYWYREKALEVKKKDITPVEVIDGRERSSKINNKRFLGRLFMYYYMPKTRMAMEYYDNFPVVFPMSLTKTGFVGLNLHYLPPNMRAILMDNLYVLSNSNNYENENTRLIKLTYEKLISNKRFRFFHPCVKQYNHRYIRSKIAFIPPNEWELALFLPTQKFVKKSESSVWMKSNRIIREKYRKV